MLTVQSQNNYNIYQTVQSWPHVIKMWMCWSYHLVILLTTRAASTSIQLLPFPKSPSLSSICYALSSFSYVCLVIAQSSDPRIHVYKHVPTEFSTQSEPLVIQRFLLRRWTCTILVVALVDCLVLIQTIPVDFQHLVTVPVLFSGITTLYVSSTPSLSTFFMCHVTYVMLTLPFHGISHMFVVAISQQSVYIPCLQLGEPQLELTCNTSSSLTCCSPQLHINALGDIG